LAGRLVDIYCRSCVETALDNLAKLRERGIDHPDMKKIETLLQTSRPQP
jgi:hypothetical protein